MTRREQLIRAGSKWEKFYAPKIYRLLHSEMRKAASILRSGGVSALRRQIDEVSMLGDIGELIQSLYVKVGVYTANDTLRAINRSAREQKGFGFNEEWIQAILNYFRLYLLQQAVIPITQTTQERILAILIKGETEGWGIDRMAFEMENDELSIARARMITRTELLKAQFYGQQLAQDKSKWETEEQWVSVHDGRTRHTHAEMDGHTIRSGGYFQVRRPSGGYDLMKGPGDPNGSAENVINCRCRTIVKAARDNNGRLIRKRNISVILPGAFTRETQLVTI